MKVDSFELTQLAEDGKHLALDIFGRIGDVWGVTGELIAYQLGNFPNAEVITLRISSRGGNARDATEIYNLLASHPARVEADVIGIAMSAATHVLMAADVRRAASNAILMVHRTHLTLDEPTTAADAREMFEMVDKVDAALVEVYASRTGLTAERVGELLDAETYMTPTEAKELGFIDEVTPAKTAAVGVHNLAEFINELPTALQSLAATWQPSKKGETTMADKTFKETLNELREVCTGADDSFLMEQMEAEATPLDAAKAWNAAQAKRLEQSEKDKAEAVQAAKDEAEKAAQAEAEAKEAEQAAAGDGLGVDPLQSGKAPVAGSGDFEAKVAELTNAGTDRITAVRQTAQRYPELHQAFLLGGNKGRQATRLLQEKYDVEVTS